TATAGLPHDNHPARIDTAVEQATVGVEAIIVSRWPGMFRCKAVVGHDHLAARPAGNHLTVEMVVVQGTGHEGAPVAVQCQRRPLLVGEPIDATAYATV